MINFPRFLLLINLFLLSSFSNAADFYWRSTSSYAQQFSTPQLACEGYTAYSNTSQSSLVHTLISVTGSSSSERTCTVKRVSKANGQQLTNDIHTVARYGNGCTPPAVYDPAKASCKTPVDTAGDTCGEKDPTTGLRPLIDTYGDCVPGYLADLPAQCKFLAKSAGSTTKHFFVQFTTDGNPINPPAPDVNGCAVKTLDASHCQLPATKSTNGVSLPPNGANCRLALVFTGEVANNGKPGLAAGSGANGEPGYCEDPKDCEPPPAPNEKQSQPCTMQIDGEGRQTCTSWDYKGDPGKQDCGQVGGQFTCITKPAQSNGIDISTKVETKSNLDGTTTTTKTDTITQTKCIGANSCVTNVSNNKSTTIKTGDGKTVSESGQCTGPACAEGGKGDKDGDGISDCVLEKCEGEEEGEAPELTAMAKPTEPGNFDDANIEWDEKIETTREDIAQKAETLGKLFQPIAALNLATGNQELGCGESFTVPGGASVSICFGKYESQLGMLAAAVLFICALIALFIIFKPD